MLGREAWCRRTGFAGYEFPVVHARTIRTMRAMRRLVALILLFIIPLQFAWSAVAGVHGHAGETAPALGVHLHSHDHDPAHGHSHPGHADEGLSLDGGPEAGHGEDGHHASHYHPVFSLILMEPGLTLGAAASGGPIRHEPAAFPSRTPPLLDRPPLVLA